MLKKKMKKENVVQQKAYRFALRMINLYRVLKGRKEYILSAQIVRSGTSVAANLEEALGGMSRKDFLAKVSIAYKEIRETNLWIRLLRDSSIISPKEAESLLRDCEELVKLIGSIKKTTQSTLKK